MFNYQNLHPPPAGAIRAGSMRGRELLRHNHQGKHVLNKACFLVMGNDRSRRVIMCDKLLTVQTQEKHES